MTRTRRAAQVISLGLFLGLMCAGIAGMVSPVPPDLFLMLDPGLMLLTGLGARTWGWAVVPAGLVLLSGTLVGRGFCGWACPMGTLLDGSDAMVKTSRRDLPSWLSAVPRMLLTVLCTASLLGVSLIFLAAPLALLTRFAGTLFYPAAALVAETALKTAHPVLPKVGLSSLAYVEFTPPVFSASLFILCFFALIFAAAKLSPRFWCRYLCPSGALLGLFSSRPAIRRRVSDACTDCGACARQCPMDAIPEDPTRTRTAVCIACTACRAVCPTDAISFMKRRPRTIETTATFPAAQYGRQSRRAFLLSGTAGAGLAAAGLTGLPAAALPSGKVEVLPVRPPGAVPEPDFLARCVRCAECATVCPTNTVQPVWFQTGWVGLFSPALDARHAPCDPRCNRCGTVCPTGALRPLPPDDRIQAKTGTAIVTRNLCLAWEQKKKCLVCDEVCPFDAVEFKSEPGNPVKVPHVLADKCAGCGYCEHHCPVIGTAAIRVSPQGEIRLLTGSYTREAQSRGLTLKLKEKDALMPAYDADTTPENTGIAPGFTK